MSTKGIPSRFRGVMHGDTLANITEVARLRATGLAIAAIAKTMGVTTQSIRNWQRRWRIQFQAAFEAAMEQAVAQVRIAAPHVELLPNLTEYLAMAEHAERWKRYQDEELFPSPSPAATSADGGNHTLFTFFETYYRVVCGGDMAKGTLKLYRQVCRKWAILTGDPPIKAINNELLAKFRDLLVKQQRYSEGKLSMHTVKMYMRHVQTLIDKCGQPGHRNRDAAGYLATTPFVRPPRVEKPEPKTVPDDHLARCYEAAGSMETPRLPGIDPPAWWRALLVLTYNVGLRRGTLFALEWRHVDFDDKLLRLPAAILKGHRKLVLPLNPVVVDHLRAIEGPRELVFDWPFSREMFGKYFRDLQTAAGLLTAQRFGLHRIRKTCATVLWKKDPAAAQLMLGHSALAITKDHYIDAVRALSGAVADVPQPAWGK